MPSASGEYHMRLAERTPPPVVPPEPPRMPPAAGPRWAAWAAVVAALGGGAGISQMVEAVRGHEDQIAAERLELLAQRVGELSEEMRAARKEAREDRQAVNQMRKDLWARDAELMTLLERGETRRAMGVLGR